MLPDLREEDISGSPFAIVAYETHQRLRRRRGARAAARAAGAAQAQAAARLRAQPHRARSPLGDRAPRVLHPRQRGGSGARSRRTTRASTPGAARAILAYGRDPYFDGWPDTFQLNYRHAGFREARIAELGAIADRCDGVRCDMAMLLQPQIIQRTWGDRARPADGSPPKDNPFWPEAIAAIKRRHPGFMFIAEVYWDMEWELQQAGFDYTYDKRLYDRLVARRGDAGARAPDGRPGVSGSLDALPREPRRAARGGGVPARRCTRRRRWSRSPRAGCASSTRGSSRGARCTCRCTSAAAPGSRSTKSCGRSTGGCSSA